MLENFKKYGQTNTHDTIKFLALMTMIIDHFGLYVIPNFLECRAVGRVAMPLFLFLVGYTHNSDKKTRYSILFYGLILYFFNYFFYVWVSGGDFLVIKGIMPANILITIFISRYVLTLLAKCVKDAYNLIGLMILSLALYIFTSPFFEYGTLAFLFAMSGKLIRTKQFGVIVSNTFLISTILFYTAIQSLMFSFDILSVIIFSVLMVGVMILMCAYTFKTISISNNMADCTIKFISRYSLQIYVIHVVLFKLYNAVIYPH